MGEIASIAHAMIIAIIRSLRQVAFEGLLRRTRLEAGQGGALGGAWGR
ncbi:hypothetical protein [Ostreiculturibacter nitratireducens]